MVTFFLSVYKPNVHRLPTACLKIFAVYTDRKNVTDFLFLVLNLACKVTCYFWSFSLVLVSVLRTSINVLSKSKSRNYVTWIANLTKLFLSVHDLWYMLVKAGVCCGPCNPSNIVPGFALREHINASSKY